MSVSNTKVTKIIKAISSEYDLDMEEICGKIKNMWKPEREVKKNTLGLFVQNGSFN
jgi:hypothetical protein